MMNTNIPIWVCSTPVDMRKGFDSLSEYVRAFLGRDPLTDGMFVFRGRSSHLLKILWYDRTGVILYYKRLHKGSFRLRIERKDVVRRGDTNDACCDTPTSSRQAHAGTRL